MVWSKSHINPQFQWVQTQTSFSIHNSRVSSNPPCSVIRPGEEVVQMPPENLRRNGKMLQVRLSVYIYIYTYTDTISTLSRIIPVLDVIWDYEQQKWVPILFLGYFYLFFLLKFHMPNPMVKHHGHCGMAIRLGELGEPRIFKCTQISSCWLYISISHSNHMFLSFLVLYPMSTLQFPKWNHYLYWFVDVHMSICFMINQSKSNVYPHFAGLND